MLIAEAWDCAPDAIHADVAVCVACGGYCTSSDLLGWVEWWDGDKRAQSPLFAYHVGSCASLVDRGAMADNGMLCDHHVKNRLGYLNHNVEVPPKPGDGGLLRCQRKPLDLMRTHRLLVAIGSPLLTADDRTAR